MLKISKITALEILDSRGNPTISCDVIINSGVYGRARVPSGASCGINEAVELRDGDKSRYNGKGVLKALANISNIIAPKLLGQNIASQQQLDALLINLDATENKSRLGANAILAVSMAFADLLAKVSNKSLYQSLSAIKDNNYILPTPMINIINGGVHADNNLDIQEFMIVPLGATNFAEAVRYGAEVFHSLKAILKKNNLNTAVGDEGGFAPNLPSHKAAIEYILAAIEQTGLRPGIDINLALDAAASEFFRSGNYKLTSENITLNGAQMVDYYADLVAQYPITSIEDGMAEDDFSGWQLLTKCLGEKIQLVGDDLFVTNSLLLQQGVDAKLANAILIKPNQIGTITETLATIKLAQDSNYNVVISHRSGETEDTFIADLAVAVAAPFIKTGSVSRGERTAKYNRLLCIAHELTHG
ncbi:MAG: phosphopyruvate hydratase [Legionellales bacterium]|nr:MAG: phosphopyruvate hydratase [Legionellales bacterium]